MIVANFEAGSRVAQAQSAYQWDYGQRLRIQGLELPRSIEVHFAQADAASSETRLGQTSNGVTDVPIPDSMFEQSETLNAFIYLTENNSGITIYRVIIPLQARPKPEEWTQPETKEIFEEALEQLRKDLEAVDDLKNNSVAEINAAKSESIAEIKAQQALENSATAAETIAYITGEREESKKEKRITLEALAAIVDEIENNVLGGLIFKLTEEGMLNIREKAEEEEN